MTDKLPEDCVEDVLDYVVDLKENDEAISAAIQEGVDDIRHGRAISLAEYRQTRGL